MTNFINFVLFQTAWFAAVLGAANGMPWIGVAAVPAVFVVHLALSKDRRPEVLLALVSVVLGLATDSLLIVAGAFSPIPYILPAPLSSLWMVMLWVNLAMTLNLSLSWLRGKYALASVFGALGGPLAYLSGAKLGAMTAVPGTGGLLAIGAAWAMAFPLLLAVNSALQKRFAQHAV